MKKKSFYLFVVLTSSLFFLFSILWSELFHDVNLLPQNALAVSENYYYNRITTHQGDSPIITITNPPTKNQIILTNFITINGTTTTTTTSPLSSSSNSAGSGIKQVDVLVSKLPFSNITSNSGYYYKLAIPVTQGNWSRWSFPVFLQEPGSYLVRSRATDNTGNQSWSDVTINFPAYIYNKRIAFVEPTFTYAAYQNGSFYNFYAKYSPLLGKLSNESKITSDLNLLKNRPIPHGPFRYYAHPKTLDIPYIDYFKIIQQHVKKNSPFVTNLTDVDVHEGKIFQANGENAYDVLFLFHNEYATASEYNNLRQFVSNGGTIVFTEANILFAEVSYNKSNDSITLVKGHYWKLDGGKAAIPSVGERWLKENKEWMGSNFFDVPSTYKVYFANNPFNYTHTEEQYVTNPQAKILINYHAYNITSDYFRNATIATYQMDYQAGKIINLGIWGHVVEYNKAFLNYFDNVIIPLALGPLVNTMQHIHKVDNGTYISVPATGPSGAVVNYLLPSNMSNSINNNNNNSQQQEFITVCRPPPGSMFPIGETMVKCIATDKTDNNNNNEIATFTIGVQDSISHR